MTMVAPLRCKPQHNFTKRVRFAPFASLITLNETVGESLEDVSSLSMDSLWYSKEEMHKQVKADVDDLVAKTKESSSSPTSSQEGTVDQPGTQKALETACPRGLEMYLPGQLIRRQGRRKSYQEALLRKRELLLTLYRSGSGNDNNDSKKADEVAERLRKFMVSRSKASRDEAHALGVQDAIDARAVYHESATPSEHLLAQKESSHMTTKQVLSTMLNHAMLRVA